MTGIYRCEPVLKWLPSYKRDQPYWCCNWTFRVRNYKEKYYMVDTYWNGCEGLKVELTDENIDKFELLFDTEKVKKVMPPDFYDYNEEDCWHIALDSGGYQYSKHYYVRKDAKKNKEALLERLNRELESLKNKVRWKEDEIERVMKGVEK
jgi:hypothetical protein